MHDDLCKHLGIDSSTDRYSNIFLNAYINHLGIDSSTDRYSNIFLNAYINHHVRAKYLKNDLIL